ncbi:hypothetical protein [Maribacter sp. MMG018]|uniref:hypothetical protein n=1 Tax=Maribacter sp. MMG018 TaxID=2822688 RepID=UPI001B3942BB|nr:hypothetical protein [Maribacter sp. MMG018]
MHNVAIKAFGHYLLVPVDGYGAAISVSFFYCLKITKSGRAYDATKVSVLSRSIEGESNKKAQRICFIESMA